MKVTNILHEIAEVVLIEAEKNNFPPTIKEALKLGNLLAYTNLINIYTLIDARVFTSTNVDCNGQPYISGIESITIGNFKIYDNGELQKDQFEAALEMFNGCEI